MSDATARTLLTRGFAFAWVSHLFHALATNTFVHLPGFLKQLGASEVLIGTLSGATALLAIVLRPALGSVFDRFGRRRCILVTGVVHVVLCAGYLAMTGLGPALYALRALHGVTEAVIFSILFTYAADIVPAGRRTEGIAWFGVSGQLPIALGGLAGDYLLPRGGYGALFTAATAVAALGLLFSVPLDDLGAVPAQGKARGVLSCAAQPNLLPLWFIGVVFATAIAPVFIFLKTYVLRTGIGSVGLFLALYSLSAASLRLFFGWVPDRVGPKRALGPAILAVALGMWLIARASTAFEIGFAGVLAGAGHGLAFPIVVGLVVERAVPAERPIAMSLVTSIFDVGVLLGGPLFGAIIEASGYGTAFGSAAVVAAAGLVLFTAWDRAPVMAGPSSR